MPNAAAELVDYSEQIHTIALAAVAGLTVIEAATPDRPLEVSYFGEGGLHQALEDKAIPAVVVELETDQVTSTSDDQVDEDFEEHRVRLRLTAIAKSKEVRGQLVRKVRLAIRNEPNLATSRVSPKFISVEFGHTTDTDRPYLVAQITMEILFHGSGAEPATPHT